MKFEQIFILAMLLFFNIGFNGYSQTSADYVAQGRSYLAVSNLAAASISFSNALGLAPTDPNANCYYAATRLLVLPSQTAGSNFLSRWGLPSTGLNIYKWSAFPAKDANGIPIAPVGVDANEASALLRTNILAVIVAAEANLAVVTDTNFTLTLTAQDTRTVGVTIDYGDIQMLRAMLQGVEYLIYNTYSWNLDAQLATIRSLYSKNNGYSIDGLLADYPSLLNFATTNDLNNARNAFVNGANRYLLASEIIRSRPSGTVRLFNYDPSNAKDESSFRLTIANIVSSLTNGIVTLDVDTNFSVFAASAFTGTHPIRSFLPRFHNQGFVVGSLPDPTFGGAIKGYSAIFLETELKNFLTPIPDILPAYGSAMQFPVRGITGRGYVIQSSSNLLDWTDQVSFVALDFTYLFSDPSGHFYSHRFYRVVDRTHSMPPPANDAFVNRIALSGIPVQTTGYLLNATSEKGEIGGFPSIWWSWTAPMSGLFVVSTVGSYYQYPIDVFTGNTLSNLTGVPYVINIFDYSVNGYAFNAVAGNTYQIRVSDIHGPYNTDNYGPYNTGIHLIIDSAPVLNVITPTSTVVITPPANLLASASVSVMQGQTSTLSFNLNGKVVASTTNLTLTTVVSNLPPGVYTLGEQVSTSVGVTIGKSQYAIVRPQNDDFANRIALPSAGGAVVGSNLQSTHESGEPNHAGIPGGASVWWSWTAPSDEFVTVSSSIIPPFFSVQSAMNLLAVYRGTNLSNLTNIASGIGSGGTTAQVGFQAKAGVTYSIAVDGSSGAVLLRLTTPLNINVTAPANQTVFYGPADVVLTADVSTTTATPISEVIFYNNSTYEVIGRATNAPFNVVWSNLDVGYYQVVAKVVDSLHNSTTSLPVSFSVVFPETPITLGIPVNNISGAAYSQKHYRLILPPGRTSLTISIFGGVGDCDMYVGYGYQPDEFSYDFAQFLPGNNESITLNPQNYFSIPDNSWHIMLDGYSAYSGVTLLAQ